MAAAKPAKEGEEQQDHEVKDRPEGALDLAAGRGAVTDASEQPVTGYRSRCKGQGQQGNKGAVGPQPHPGREAGAGSRVHGQLQRRPCASLWDFTAELGG